MVNKFKVGDKVELIDNHSLSLPLFTKAVVKQVGHFLTVKWLTNLEIGQADGAYYNERFRKVGTVKKLKRKVLGEGYPYFIYDKGKGYYAVCLQQLPGRPNTNAGHKKLKFTGLGDWKKVKLIAEYK